MKDKKLLEQKIYEEKFRDVAEFCKSQGINTEDYLKDCIMDYGNRLDYEANQGKIEIPIDKASQKSAMLSLFKPFPIRPIDFKEGK